MLRLGEQVKYTYFMKPICLPRTQQLRTKGYDGETLDVAGWGKTETGMYYINLN